MGDSDRKDLLLSLIPITFTYHPSPNPMKRRSVKISITRWPQIHENRRWQYDYGTACGNVSVGA